MNIKTLAEKYIATRRIKEYSREGRALLDFAAWAELQRGEPPLVTVNYSEPAPPLPEPEPAPKRYVRRK